VQWFLGAWSSIQGRELEAPNPGEQDAERGEVFVRRETKVIARLAGLEARIAQQAKEVVRRILNAVRVGDGTTRNLQPQVPPGRCWQSYCHYALSA
jgi:hypothetical protein